MERRVPQTVDGKRTLAELGLKPEQLPAHVAIIMDGNGRWAQRRGRPRMFGHRAGLKSVRAVVEEACQLGLAQLSLYCLSSENWKRPPHELSFLMRLLRHYLKSELPRMQQQNIRLAINYGGRTELADAARQLAADVQAGRLELRDVDEDRLASYLSTAGMPDPDLLIRTAGELRISNFLLWQVSYAELYVTDVLWPEFRARDLHHALLAFAKRQRKFGALPLPEPTPVRP